MTESPTEKKNIWLPLLLSFIMVAGMVIGLKLKDTSSVFEKVQDEDLSSLHAIEIPLLQVVRYIDSKYVDSLDNEHVAETAIRNLIHELDPHSVYLPRKEYVHSKEQLNGSFVGIGIDFMIINDTVTVGSVISDSPAEKAGLHSGDKILKIKDLLIAGTEMTADTIVSLLKGERGDQLNLTCLNVKTKKSYDATIVRDDVSLPSIPSAFIIKDQVGYVNITSYTRTTSREFAQAVKDLIDNQGMQDLIIDLRSNPGGYLEEAVDVLNHIFLDKHKLLVYTAGSRVGKNDHKSNGSSRLNIKKIAVLINEESASASEITAGALQDWDRAVIVGRRSFGKGLVQEDLMLSNGGVIRMTVARYYTPSGRCIQKDYSDRSKYEHELRNRYDNGELFEKDEIVEDTTSYFTANGRIVHGGGGISPEVYVPLDSSLVQNEWLLLNSKAYEFILSRHPSISGMSSSDFLRNYRVSELLVDDFIAFANANEKKLDFKSKQKYLKEIRRSLKSYIGKIYFGESMRYKVRALDNDPFVAAALKQLKKSDVLKID